MSSIQGDALLTAQFLPPDNILLTTTQINQAIDLARHAATEAEQWQTYLTSLALLGLRDWLDQRSPDLKLESDFLEAERLHPRHRAAPQAPHSGSLSQQVGTMRIAQTQIQVLITDCLADPLVVAPPPHSATRPDFYLLVEVLEELSEVRVRGYLPQASAQAVQQAIPIASVLSPNGVLLPIQAFNPDPSGLLMHLRSQVTVAQMQQPSLNLAALPNQINLGLWLQDRLGRVAEMLSWHLLPPAALNLSGALLGGDTGGGMGGAMHQISGDLNAVLRELRATQGITIPTSARAGERDLELEEIGLKLYVLTWIPAPDQWALLLILGAQPGSLLPLGLRLKVESDQELLSDERLTANPYLYSLVVGEPHEQFRVTVTAPTGAALTLTPFGFDPSEESC